MTTGKLLAIVIPISIAFGMMFPLAASVFISKKAQWIKFSYVMAAFVGLAIGWFIGGTCI